MFFVDSIFCAICIHCEMRTYQKASRVELRDKKVTTNSKKGLLGTFDYFR